MEASGQVGSRPQAPEPSGRDKWVPLVQPYWGPDRRRSAVQLLTSAVPFFALWAAAWWSLRVGYWLTLLLAVAAAGFQMRLFLIQHDLGHGSFFRSRRTADVLGFFLGVVTLTPYRYWRKTHALHHAHSGDLDLRGFGDVDTLTVNEYLALPRWKRALYRVYRNPFFLFGVGAPFHFLVKHRYPWDLPREWKREWASVWYTNLALMAVLAVAAVTVGLRSFLLVQIPITLMSAMAGVWLFYVQHQYEETYWHDHEEWDYFEASIHGSSHLVLPKPLQWITASIGLHHIHHLSARIPNYRLQQVYDENPELQVATRLTMKDTLDCLFLSLWDEDERRLVRFRDVKGRTLPPGPPPPGVRFWTAA